MYGGTGEHVCYRLFERSMLKREGLNCLCYERHAYSLDGGKLGDVADRPY